MAKAELEIKKYDADPTGEPNAALGFLGGWKISYKKFDFVCNVESTVDFMRFEEAIDFEPTPFFFSGPAIDVRETAKEFKIVEGRGKAVGIYQKREAVR